MTSETTIYTAQKIITMNPRQPNAKAVAVRGDKILAVGSRAEVSQVAGEVARIVDLGAKTVVPGFIEAHSHLQVYGAVSQYLDLFPWTTHNLENLFAKIRNAQPPTPRCDISGAHSGTITYTTGGRGFSSWCGGG
jgi:predicted amidohydrolase YtcJ